MPDHWPSPEEAEEERQRLDALRLRHHFAAIALCVALLVVLVWQFARLAR